MVGQDNGSGAQRLLPELHDVLPMVPLPILAILDVVPLGIIIADHDGHIVHWSKGCERLFGYTSDEVRSDPIGLLLSKRYRPELELLMNDVRRSSSDVSLFSKSNVMGDDSELSGLRKNGSEFPCKFSLVGYKDAEHGGELCFFGIVEDRRVEAFQQADAGFGDSFEKIISSLRRTDDDLKRFAPDCGHEDFNGQCVDVEPSEQESL